MAHMYEKIQNLLTLEDHHYELLHAFYANMSKTAMTCVHGIIITMLASLSIHTIDMYNKIQNI
jgi:hypothetical protein